MIGQGQTRGLPERSGLVIATVMEADARAIDAGIERAAGEGADAVEVRLDAAPGIDPEAIGHGSGVPLLAACRRRESGGAYAGSEDERVRLLDRAAATGRFLLDVEIDTPAMHLARTRPRAIGVVSHHDFGGTERDLHPVADRLLAALPEEVPGAFAKLVTTAVRATDNFAIREVLATHPARLAAFAMGDPGVPSRLLCGAWGSRAVWAAARAGAPGASGQIALKSLLGRYRFRRIGPATRLFAIAGRPVRGSLSPAIHNAVFAEAGIDALYMPIATADADELVTMIRGLPLAGVSITAPLKAEIVRFLDEADPAVLAAGACNTLVVGSAPARGAGAEGAMPVDGAGSSMASSGARVALMDDQGKPIPSADAPHLSMSARGVRGAAPLAGFNTDAAAVREELDAHISLRGRRVVIVGAGGAARAAAFALREVAELVIAARDAGKARALASMFGGLSCSLADLGPDPEAVLLQASSAPADDPVVPRRAIAGRFVLDMRYAAAPTGLVLAAQEAGIPAADGLGMLLRQAREQVRLFTGRTCSLERLEAAALAARGEDAA